MSGASERASGQVSGPVLQSVFLDVLDHGGASERGGRNNYGGVSAMGVELGQRGDWKYVKKEYRQ